MQLADTLVLLLTLLSLLVCSVVILCADEEVDSRFSTGDIEDFGKGVDLADDFPSLLTPFPLTGLLSLDHTRGRQDGRKGQSRCV